MKLTDEQRKAISWARDEANRTCRTTHREALSSLLVAPVATAAAAPSDADCREHIARALHYPACWDIAAYPTLESAAWEAIACAKLGCSTCKESQSDERAAFEQIIAMLQEDFDTEGITENDSGDALVRLSSAIAYVKEVAEDRVSASQGSISAEDSNSPITGDRQQSYEWRETGPLETGDAQ